MATAQMTRSPDRNDHAHRQVSAVGWGLLFVWVGIAALAQVGWGFGLLGVGLIILGSQAVHLIIGGVRLDWFSTICGLLFLMGGVWELFSISFGLVPALSIVAGALLLLSALTSRPAR